MSDTAPGAGTSPGAGASPGAGTSIVRVGGLADNGDAIVVEVPSSLVDLLHSRWPRQGLTGPMPIEASAATARKRLAVTTDRVSGTANAIVDGLFSPGSWERIESELAIFAAERLAGLVAVHAAVLVVDGRVLLLPGSSGVGKSTLTMAAHASGATVLSDEYALVDPHTGLVTGWHRPVRVRRPTGGVDLVDIVSESPPLPVAAVALVHFDAALGDTWAPIPASEGVLGLLANTVCARSRPDESLDAALAIAGSATCVRGSRGEATTAVAPLLALLTPPRHTPHTPPRHTPHTPPRRTQG